MEPAMTHRESENLIMHVKPMFFNGTRGGFQLNERPFEVCMRMNDQTLYEEVP